METVKPHYKLIILIIASSGESYDLFAECWREYMNLFPEVKSLFVLSDIDLEDEFMVFDNAYIYKDLECIVPGILKKTISAMKYCNDTFTYDHLLRTNLSSFIHIPRALKFLSCQKNHDYAAGHFNCIPDDPSQHNKHAIINQHFNKILNEKFVYLHGAAIFFSSDVVVKLAAEFERSSESILTLPDDVAISLMLYDAFSFDSSKPISEIFYYCPKQFKNTFLLKHQCKGDEEPYAYNDDIIHIRNKVDDNLSTYSYHSIELRGKEIMNYIKQIRYFYKKPHFMDYIDAVPEKKVIDAFLFNNELDMLEYRLSISVDVVNVFILVESRRTIEGETKPLYYSENKERFEKYNSKIIHIVVDEADELACWDAIDRGVQQLELTDFDYILIGRIDEIPDPATLDVIKYENNAIQFATLRQDQYSCNLNRIINQPWSSAKIITYSLYSNYINHGKAIFKMRESVTGQIIHHGGWRMSMFGDIDFIKQYIREQNAEKYKTEDILSEEKILTRIERLNDIFVREDMTVYYLSFEDNTYIPPGDRDQFPFIGTLTTPKPTSDVLPEPAEDFLNAENQFSDNEFEVDMDNAFEMTTLDENDNSETPLVSEFAGFGNMV